jgi:hypothetical protein
MVGRTALAAIRAEAMTVLRMMRISSVIKVGELNKQSMCQF